MRLFNSWHKGTINVVKKKILAVIFCLIDEFDLKREILGQTVCVCGIIFVTLHRNHMGD